MCSSTVFFGLNRARASVVASALLVALGGCREDAGSPTAPEVAPSFALASNTWTEKAPKPGIPLEAMSAAHFPNSAGQSLVYLIGGAYRPGDEPVRTGFAIAIYNAATNTWATTDDKVGVFSTNGVGAIGNKLYFSGGYSGEEDGIPIFSRGLWAYDVVTSQLTRKADMPKRTAEGVTGAIGGQLYVLAGQCDADARGQGASCKFQDTRRFFRYSPATNSWDARQAAPHVHRKGAAGVIDGKLYVAGGLANFGNRAVADLDVYDPATNTWKTLAPMPRGGAAIGTVLDGKLFVITGSNAYFYNPQTNTWTTRAAPEFAHDAVVRVRIDGDPFLLAVGGNHGPAPGTPNATELYTP